MSTRQLSVTLQKRLDAIVEALRPIAKLGVLYGSQLVRPILGSGHRCYSGIGHGEGPHCIPHGGLPANSVFASSACDCVDRVGLREKPFVARDHARWSSDVEHYVYWHIIITCRHKSLFN